MSGAPSVRTSLEALVIRSFVRLCWSELYLSGALFDEGFVRTQFVTALFVRISGGQELFLSGALTVRTLSGALVIRSFVKLCYSVLFLSIALVDEGFVRCSICQRSFCQELWLTNALSNALFVRALLSRALFCHKHCWSRTIFVMNSCIQDLWMPGIFVMFIN